MYSEIKTNFRCSRCGMIDYYEYFQRHIDNMSGMRCLSCGHEKVNKEPESHITSWTINQTDPMEF